MNDFNALLKRSFAEADEPVDDGFSVKIAHAVAQREAGAQMRSRLYVAAMGVAGLAVFYAAYALASALAPQVLASAGLEIAQAYGALASGPSVAGQGVMHSLAAGLTPLLFITAAMAGGAVAYRAAQQG